MRAAPRGAAAEPDAPSAAAMSKRPARALGAHAACAQRRPIDAISSPGSIDEAHTVQDVAYLAVSGTRTGYGIRAIHPPRRSGGAEQGKMGSHDSGARSGVSSSRGGR